MKCAVIHNHEVIDVSIGVNVGRTHHYAVALDNAGKERREREPPQDGAKPRHLSKPREGALPGNLAGDLRSLNTRLMEDLRQ